MYLVYVVFTVKFSITQFLIGPLVWIYNVISMYLHLLYICVKSLWSLTWQYIYIYGYRWQTAALLSAIGRLTVQRSLVPSSQGGLWTTESWPKAHCEVTCLLPLTKWESWGYEFSLNLLVVIKLFDLKKNSRLFQIFWKTFLLKTRKRKRIGVEQKTINNALHSS